MTEHGFLGITTHPDPPLGARDYLVPARNHPGKFMPLRRSSSAVLMTSALTGTSRSPPAFQDGTPGRTRSPSEFYQLDMEMAPRLSG